MFGRLTALAGERGLVVRGGFHPLPDDGVPPLAEGVPTGTLVLLGVVGDSVWRRFSAERLQGPDPLDTWTRSVADDISRRTGARVIHPNDRPFMPFQKWAKRSEPVHESPLGLLIHPEYGLWHAYRAALLFADILDLPERGDHPSPCATCSDKPCLAACPVGAFSPAGYDVSSCATHLRSDADPDCLTGGCRARDACPVGTGFRYGDGQIRFHMAAFERALP